MRFRKANVILGIALIVGIFLFFFLIIDTSPRGLYWDDDAKKAELKYLEDKLKSLENDFVVRNNLKSSKLKRYLEVTKLFSSSAK